jgi:hypothetical protein
MLTLSENSYNLMRPKLPKLITLDVIPLSGAHLAINL